MTEPRDRSPLAPLRNWLASLPAGVLVLERNRVTDANAAFLQLAGCTWEEIENASLAGIVTWDRETDSGAASRQVPAVSPAGATLRVKDRPPLRVWISREDLGASTTIFSVVEAETATQEDDRQYRDLIEHALLGVMRSTDEGRILMANSALGRMLGYARTEELLATSLNDVYLDPDERRRVLARFAAERRATISGVEARWKRRNGEIILVRLTGRITAAKQGRTFEVIVEDITLQRRLEETLQQTDRLVALGRLAAGVAHDFNNLLTVIIGHADMLAAGDHPPNSPEARESAAAIEHAVRSGAGLTRQLLAFSRAQELKPEQIDIDAAIASTERLIRQLLPDSVELVIVRGPNPLRVEIDPIQLEQILLNLTTNAADAMPDGGTLWITVRRAELGRDAFGPHVALAQGAYVEISVLDTGHGMDARTKARVFEPFFSTKPRGRGTGLGLATVYGIVKQSGGFIFVDSTPGIGTRFRIYFPEAHDMPARAEPAPPAGREDQVLLMMADRAARRDAAAGLKALGHHVLEAATPDEALGLVTAHNVRCFVSDVALPGTDARTLHEALEARAGGGIKALFLVRPDDPPAIDEHHWVLDVPFTIAQLARRVSDLLNERQL